MNRSNRIFGQVLNVLRKRMMSLETFNSYMKTFYLLRSSANAAHLTKSICFYNCKLLELYTDYFLLDMLNDFIKD